MSNPVFNRLDKQWNQEAVQRQNAALNTQPQSPTYPYGPGMVAPAGSTYDQQAFQQAQQAYQGPTADAVDMGRMTYDDVIMKTLFGLGTLVIAGAAAWWLTMSNPSLGVALMMGGLLVGFVLAMVNIFSKSIRPALVLAYAAAEGVALGSISAVTEAMFPGIVVQAVVATAVVFAVTLALFASGKVRNSPKLMKFTLIALIGIIVTRILLWVLSSFGLGGSGSSMSVELFGITMPLGALISVVAVVIGALCLISDFDQAKVGVETGAPAKYAWACAFGIMVTVVWMYIEILNILASFRSN